MKMHIKFVIKTVIPSIFVNHRIPDTQSCDITKFQDLLGQPPYKRLGPTHLNEK